MSKTQAYIDFIRTLPDSHPLVQDYRNMMRCRLKSVNDTQYYAKSETEKTISSNVIDEIIKRHTNEKSDNIKRDSCDEKDSDEKDSDEKDSDERDGNVDMCSTDYYAESKNDTYQNNQNECLPDHTDVVPHLDLSVVIPHSLSDSVLNRAPNSKTSPCASLTDIEKRQNVYDTFSSSVNK